MSLVGRKATNHPQQVAVRGAGEDVDDRGTPPEIFDPLHERFRFTIDAAASPHNAKLPRYWTKAENGLEQNWLGERVWCNPPYSDIRPWVEKAHLTSVYVRLTVMLLPANRCEQRWWQDFIEPYRDSLGGPRVRFLPGRPRFIGPPIGGPKGDRPPFGLVLVGWGLGEQCDPWPRVPDQTVIREEGPTDG